MVSASANSVTCKERCKKTLRLQEALSSILARTQIALYCSQLMVTE